MSKTYRGFVSHAWAHSDPYQRLTELLDDANYFDWENFSVPEHDNLDAATERELKRELREQISPTNHVLILAGMWAEYSKWIDYEIEVAEDFGKPIIGVEPWGQERTPDRVTDASDTMVGWNTNTIVGAIRDQVD